MDNQENLANWVYKTKKKSQHNMYWTPLFANIRHYFSYTQTEGKDEPNIILMKK